MPRQSDGTFTLVPGNPVIPDTVIEAKWANDTMPDIANGLTGSVARDGSTPMSGPLRLSTIPPVESREAVSKGYVDQFIAYSTGMPIGSVAAYPSSSMPVGFLLCNGQQVDKVLYPALYALIGTTFGPETSSTFAVPDLRGWFIRGRDPATRAAGSTQTASFAAHTHPVNDPGHVHNVNDPQHTHIQNSHGHTASQDPHTHSVPSGGIQPSSLTASSNSPNYSGVQTTGPATPSIVVDVQTATNQSSLTGISIANGQAGVSTAAAGDTETRPQNIALDFYIKAVDDSTTALGITGITSSDSQVVAIDSTDAAVPKLVIKSNQAYGLPKLDANAKMYPAQMPFGALNYQGPWDASTGQTPSQTFPATVFADGDMYQVSVQGTLTVYQANGVLGPVVCGIGSQITYMTNSPTLPVPGWYYNPPLTLGAVGASQVGFVPFPAGGISANNVQLAIEEVATERVPLNGANATGTWGISVSGNAATATTATNATNATNATTAAACSGNSATATTAAACTGNSATATNALACSGNSATATTAAACSGNSATATTAAACSGNSATATYSKQVPLSLTAGNLLASDAGKCVDLGASITITGGVMAAGDTVSFYNTTGAPVTLTQGAGMALHLSGSGASANKTLAAFALCTIWFRQTGQGIVSGTGVS